eukprot:768500-Hanusia_phi.AAC.11
MSSLPSSILAARRAQANSRFLRARFSSDLEMTEEKTWEEEDSRFIGLQQTSQAQLAPAHHTSSRKTAEDHQCLQLVGDPSAPPPGQAREEAPRCCDACHARPADGEQAALSGKKEQGTGTRGQRGKVNDERR